MTSKTPAASASILSQTLGFADGGSDTAHLFIVNPLADATAANDFAHTTRAALKKLLDNAIMANGMDGDTLQLVQHLMDAIEAATGHAINA